MNCTRCGYYDRSNRKLPLSGFANITIVVNEITSNSFFLCEKCEEYAYLSLDELAPPETDGTLPVCQYCGNEEVKTYQGLNFTDMTVITPSGRLFPAGYRAKLHRECAGYVFNQMPVRYSGIPLPEKWFSPRRPYIASYSRSERDDD